MGVARYAARDVKKRAKNINTIRSNRNASEQALFFGNSRTGQDAWKTFTKGGSRPLSKEERMNMNRNYREQGREMRGSLEEARTKMKNAKTPEERKQAQNEMRSIASDMRDHRQMNPSGITETSIGTKDRMKALGTATSEYFLGGTAKQNLSRMGGVAGAIVGVPIAIDAASNAIGSNSSYGGY